MNFGTVSIKYGILIYIKKLMEDIRDESRTTGRSGIEEL